MRPDEAALRHACRGVTRRILLTQCLAGVTAGTLLAAGVALLSGPRTTGAVSAWMALAAASVLSTVWYGRRERTAEAAARRIEVRHPGCRNVVITSIELMAHPERAAAWMRAHVLRAGAAQVVRLNPADVQPVSRHVLLLVGAVTATAAIIGGGPHLALQSVLTKSLRLAGDGTSPPVPAPTVVARLRPPAYTGSPARDVVNPERLDALEGTALTLTITGFATPWRIRFGERSIPAVALGERLVADTVLTESGYFALEPAEAGMGERRLLPVSVSRDQTPVVRIEAPARDLLLQSPHGRVPIVASASDDFGVRDLEVRYTKVSGTGEEFDFQEGRLPITLTERGERLWRASGTVLLDMLKLEPGDSLVYRAVSRDARPGDAGLSSSETFFIEIAGPGQIALDGLEMPPERDRYALSQQMIVLKIQRLKAREATLAREALMEESAAIAAEQRAVRSNFIFLMGGHVEDEKVEAEQSSEIAEGRLRSSAVQDMSAAIGLMGRAERELTAGNLGGALPPARAAVAALQRAFGRTRYILRTTSARSRIDPSRRLTGELKTAADWTRVPGEAPLDREASEARRLLTRLLELAAAVHAGRRIDPAAFAVMAEEAIAIDPGSAEWRRAAERLEKARELAKTERSTELAAVVNDTVRVVLARAQAHARPPGSGATDSPSPLLSAWADGAKR